MKKVRDNSAVPRGGTFIYRHEDGYEQRHSYFSQLKEWVREYKRINNLPIGLQFDDEYEENICSNADPITCEEWYPPGPLQKAQNLAAALVRAAKGGFKAVSSEILNERLAICANCNFYGGQNGLLKVICKRCGCGGLKAYLKSEKCPIGKWT